MKKIVTKKMKLSDLSISFYVRKTPNHDWILELAELLEGEIKFTDNIWADEQGNIIDGRHRYEAFELMDVEEVDVDIYSFKNEVEKIRAAYGANSGGSLPPDKSDNEYTIRLLLDQNVTQKTIADIVGLPPKLIRGYVNIIRSKDEKRNLVQARNGVTEDNLSVASAAVAFNVNPQKLREFLGGGKKKRDMNSTDSILKGLVSGNKTHSQRIGGAFRKLMTKLDDGEVTPSEIKKFVSRLELMNSRSAKSIRNWNDRLLARSGNGKD